MNHQTFIAAKRKEISAQILFYLKFCFTSEEYDIDFEFYLDFIGNSPSETGSKITNLR